MKPTLCSRCKKNLAVIFITKIDGGKTVNEGLCLKCAKEMGIKPVDDMIERMGLSEDDLENLNGEMTEAMNGLEGLLGQSRDPEEDGEDDEADSQTATFPFLNKLFGAAGQGQDNTPAVPEPEKTESRQRSGDKPNSKNKKHKFLDTYCQGLIEEVKKLGNIILVIDEVHNLVGAGDAEGSMNAANILKPALSRGEIQVIGATTFNEYRKHIEKDAALERRFQPVTVAEPTIEQSIAIIRGISHYYETFHGVVISPEIARQAVLLSERYITDRFLPDKAIDLIDEACSDVNLKNKNIGRLEALRKEHADYDLELSMLTENAEKTQDDYARMAELRSRNLQLDSEIAELEKLPKPALTIDNLARIIELWTKIPASKIRAQEYEQLLNLDAELKKHIVGQDEAIASVVSAIRRSRVGIQVKKHPVSFIFVGSTGVGKTELVKRLASEMFESVESLIRLDMSEYMEKHSVSKIIGSPPGYVGYDEAGQLTEKIRRRPYSVILFDELEKAHPDVLNILLQILDDGRITDAQGRVVNFENTIIIMTSNAGSSQKGGSVGFGRSLTEQSKEKAMKALSEFLRPEFINRVDEIVCFNQLSEENFRGIADIMLSELKQSLESRGIEFAWDESVKDYLVKKSYSVSYGARNLRRAIQTDLEDPIAERIIKSYVDPFSSIKATCEDGKIKLETV